MVVNVSLNTYKYCYNFHFFSPNFTLCGARNISRGMKLNGKKSLFALDEFSQKPMNKCF